MATASEHGNRLPDITNSVDAIRGHCNLVSGIIMQGKSSDVIYRFSTSGLMPSDSFVEKPSAMNNLIGKESMQFAFTSQMTSTDPST